jgi:hypothetical protein
MRRLAAVLGLCAFFAMAPTARAATGSNLVITELTTETPTTATNKSFVRFSNLTCTVDSATPTFYFKLDTPEREAMHRMLMAALLSGRKVDIGYSTSTCEIYRVTIKST